MVLVSLILIGLTLSVCDFLRQQISARFRPSLARSLSLDFFVSMEQCFVAFEMGAIIDHHGKIYWSLMLVAMTMYQVLRWKDYSGPSPIIHFLDNLKGSKGMFEVILRSAILLASGLLAYRYAKAIWMLEVSSSHLGRPQSLDACVTPWKDVPIYQSGSAEFVGAFILFILPQIILDNPVLSNNDLIYSALIIGLVVLVTVVAALDFSGGLFNPMLASVLFGGCKGHTMLEHVLIYWLCPSLGAVLAYIVYPSVEKMIYKKTSDNNNQVKPMEDPGSPIRDQHEKSKRG